MKHILSISFTLCLFAGMLTAGEDDYARLTKDFVRGPVPVMSMSVLSFGPEGILFVGDSKAGKLYALDLEDRAKNDSKEAFVLEDIEPKLAALLGTDTRGVVIHDVAANPLSQNIYLSVSRADAKQISFWRQPNDLGYANILLRVTPKGEISEVSLQNIRHSAADVPQIISEGKENWRKSDERTDAITDIAYADGKLYIAGLSNEEFASVLRVLEFPFAKDGKKNQYSTIEVYHVAHGKSETEAPIRTLHPYTYQGQSYILAAYTCTPFVSIPVGELKNGQHVKAKTLGEFGYGNMPVDIIQYRNGDKDFLLMSSTAKALIRIDAGEIPKQEKGLTEPLGDDEYAVGLPHAVLSKIGITQIDNYNADHVLLLQRMPNGMLNLHTHPIGRL